MAGAKHITQRVVFQGPSSSRSRRRQAETGPAAATFDNILTNIAKDGPSEELLRSDQWRLNKDQGLLVLEFMSRGNLNTYLEKVGAQGTRFPDQILWQIFHCRKCATDAVRAKEPRAKLILSSSVQGLCCDGVPVRIPATGI